ncbi:MAG: hypothetical protein GX823_02150, partial [Clostridiales bacterium]|nr:hypothetical protein [Clostridiales bacterium]
LSLTINSFINWETGVCSFDESFVKLLEFVAKYPEEIDWEALYDDPDYWMNFEEAYKDNSVLLQEAYISSYRAVRDYAQQFAEDVCFVGYPTPDRTGSVFYSYAQHGVSAMSPNKQVCFDFLASVVETEPDFENSGGYFYGSFSLSQKYMDAVRKYELTPMKERPGYVDYNDYGEVEPYDAEVSTASARTMPMPYPEYEDDYEANYHLKPEEVAEIDRLFETATEFYSYNEQVMNIIIEEANEFFANRRSADDTARMIQSRVQIFVSESM